MLCRFNRLMMCSAILFFGCSFGIWVSLGFHQSLSELSQDMCNEWNIYLTQQENKNQTNAALKIFFSCLEANGTWGDISQVLNSYNSSKYSKTFQKLILILKY